MSKFQQFLKERKYLTNVKACVMRMREAGLKASSVNCRLRSINAYLKWTGSKLKVPKLKEEQRVLPTFSAPDISRFMKCKPKSHCERRLQLLILLLADCGCRLNEALVLTWSDVDFDNLLLTLKGKGGKERKVPCSFELRKMLFRWKGEHRLVFSTADGKKLGRRNMLRDVKRLSEDLGIGPVERTIHALRHTFCNSLPQKWRLSSAPAEISRTLDSEHDHEIHPPADQ